jgi:hypothetical protein
MMLVIAVVEEIKLVEKKSAVLSSVFMTIEVDGKILSCVRVSATVIVDSEFDHYLFGF